MNRIGLLSTCMIAWLAMASSSWAKSEKRSLQVELVRRLYRNFVWETVLYPEAGETLAEQPKGVLKDYFEGALADLLASDAECARKKNVCRLDVDPLFGTRNPVAHNLEVLPTDSATGVLVRFYGVEGGSESITEVVVQMTGSGSGSRITDMVYRSGPTLKDRLTAPQE